MTRKDNVAKPTNKRDLDKATIHMLGIKPDAQVLSSEELELVQQIKGTCDLTDFTPMNQKYGPMSGISIGQRLIRAYRLGLLLSLCQPVNKARSTDSSETTPTKKVR